MAVVEQFYFFFLLYDVRDNFREEVSRARKFEGQRDLLHQKGLDRLSIRTLTVLVLTARKHFLDRFFCNSAISLMFCYCYYQV
jgi:hypothetical protein